MSHRQSPECLNCFPCYVLNHIHSRLLPMNNITLVLIISRRKRDESTCSKRVNWRVAV